MIFATSIMPSNDLEVMNNQINAIKSWKRLGIDIISCNVLEEIEELKEKFSGVKFVEIKRSGRDIFKKPYPYIYDMIECLIREKDDIYGIINSDIVLANMDVNMLREINKMAKDHLICIRRYDVDAEKEYPIYYGSGGDVFIFGKDIASIYNDDGLMMGRAEWDHWMGYIATKNKIPIVEIKKAVAYHRKHKQRWMYEQMNGRIVEFNKSENATDPNEYYEITNKILSDLEVRRNYISNEHEEIVVNIVGNPKDTTLKSIEAQTYSNIVYEKENAEGGVEFNINNNLFYDKDCIAMLIDKLEKSEASEVFCEVGIGYEYNGKYFRIGNLNGELREKNICKINRATDNKKSIHMEEVLAFINLRKIEWFNQIEDFYIYPAGRGAYILAQALIRCGKKPKGFIDKDEQLHGKNYLGCSIYNIDILDDKASYDKVIICSNTAAEEIYNELSKRIGKEKLVLI